MRKQYVLVLIIILVLIFSNTKTKTYTVKFLDNDTLLASITKKKGSTLSNIDEPKKEGYLFLNWLKDGQDYNLDTPIKENLVLEAKWIKVPNTVKTYQITFNYGNETKTMSVKEGEKVSVPSLSFKEDKYLFLGWYLDDTKYDFDTPVSSDLTLTAKFEKIMLTISYDLAGGSGTTQNIIEKGSIPNRPKNPTKNGYTFTNWTIDDKVYNFDTPINENTTIKANYEKNKYVSIMFDTDGGSNLPSQIILSGDTISDYEIPKKEGYIFQYWSLDGEKFDMDTVITEDITLLAIYKKENENKKH